MRADVVRKSDVVTPDDQDVTFGQPGDGVELLRQRSESPRHADDLPAAAGVVLQLAGIIKNNQFTPVLRVVLPVESQR